MDFRSFITHLECTACHREYSATRPANTCPACGKVLYARYDLSGARRTLTKGSLSDRPHNLWRYAEIMPVCDERHRITLGEGMTPLLRLPRLGASLGCDRLYLKDEGLNPTGTFKVRGLAAAVAKAKELGVMRLAMPSAGNAGAALAAYGARAGLEVTLFVPTDAPLVTKLEGSVLGARVYLVRGLINDCGDIVRRLGPERGWFDLSTLKEPYRVEGKKTLGLEMAEQLEWSLPDAILYPTGGGTGIVGIWKAFAELEELGFIGLRRPKMIAVQADGCAPIVKAFHEGKRHAEFWPNADTVAGGIRVPAAIGDYLILDAIRQSGGTAVSVSDEEILAAVRDLARLEGIFAAPEGAATLAGLRRLLAEGFLRPSDRIVLLNTGAGIKYPEVVQATFPEVSPDDPEVGSKVR